MAISKKQRNYRKKKFDSDDEAESTADSSQNVEEVR
jgi:hypothetical protein